jgi:hypothetical protein
VQRCSWRAGPPPTSLGRRSSSTEGSPFTEPKHRGVQDLVLGSQSCMLSVLAEFQRELSISNTNKDSPQPTPADASEAAARRVDGQCPSRLKDPYLGPPSGPGGRPPNGQWVGRATSVRDPSTGPPGVRIFTASIAR